MHVLTTTRSLPTGTSGTLKDSLSMHVLTTTRSLPTGMSGTLKDSPHSRRLLRRRRMPSVAISGSRPCRCRRRAEVPVGATAVARVREAGGAVVGVGEARRSTLPN